ncbi:chemotaxis protein CheV [Psychromonas sp. Urea-02u-13]|uniref:chemotaxis protein CheV n=1 Tax=Psychromonas sp. Urea-02u-13 TaxID=2058326 RepID=UPI000C32D798|nr:chemotaxis protein CheV [Psychromonas sp. Urea-02u-13]PKG40352.1 chemotaxis protein CheW [Psychromonas sp. Urea-02u-13]
MTSLLNSVDQRTNLVGENRLELLLFHLQGRQLFAINVFKVKEVVKLPPLNRLPNAHPKISGVANIRGQSIPVINLREAVGFRPIDVDEECNLIITEYNRTIQGFLVGKVERIVNMTWKEIMHPPSSVGRDHYLTAITKLQKGDREEIVEIIDVEKVLAEIIEYDVSISEGVLDNEIVDELVGVKILHADDSSTARKQVESTLSQLGIEIIPAENGLQALEILKSWAAEGKRIEDEILMLITDAEMPIMDGYKLTSEVRANPDMSELYIVLNTSLSGSFNQAMVEKVGCNALLSKFQPDRLVEAVQERLKAKLQRK